MRLNDIKAWRIVLTSGVEKYTEHCLHVLCMSSDNLMDIVEVPVLHLFRTGLNRSIKL